MLDTTLLAPRLLTCPVCEETGAVVGQPCPACGSTDAFLIASVPAATPRFYAVDHHGNRITPPAEVDHGKVNYGTDTLDPTAARAFAAVLTRAADVASGRPVTS